MASRYIDHRFQHRLPRTTSPTRLDYDRALLPMADQPLLELRRPSNEDWDSVSDQTYLLDRFLRQPTCPSRDEEPLWTHSEEMDQMSNSPGSTLPTGSNNQWPILSQRVGFLVSCYHTP